MAKRRNFTAKSPLMYEWYQEYYVGAAHGLAGIYYYLMQVRGTEGEGPLAALSPFFEQRGAFGLALGDVKLGFVLLCCVKHKEPGSANQCCTNDLGEANTEEENIGFLMLYSKVMIFNFQVINLGTIWSLDESAPCSLPGENRTAEISRGAVSLERDTEATPLLPSEVSSCNYPEHL